MLASFTNQSTMAEAPGKKGDAVKAEEVPKKVEVNDDIASDPEEDDLSDLDGMAYIPS